MKTSYKLLERRDIEACHKLLEKHRMRRGEFGFPTIVAKRNRRIVGLLATRPSTEAVIAGPLLVALPSRAFVAMRLVEAYEIVLKASGVTSYLFHIKKENPWARQAAEAFGIEHYAEDVKGNLWFKRELKRASK